MKIKINWGIVIRNLLIIGAIFYCIRAENKINDLKFQIETLEHQNETLQIEKKELSEDIEQAQLEEIETRYLSCVEKNTGLFRASAYCKCEKCCGKWATLNGGGITASGTKVQEGRTVAVYPKQIPLGTEVYIEGMGTYIAEDTGSAIKENCIDIYFDSHEEALEFGVKYLNVEW